MITEAGIVLQQRIYCLFNCEKERSIMHRQGGNGKRVNS